MVYCFDDHYQLIRARNSNWGRVFLKDFSLNRISSVNIQLLIWRPYWISSTMSTESEAESAAEKQNGENFNDEMKVRKSKMCLTF